MKQSKGRFVFVAAFMCAVLYVLFFPIPAGKELFLFPAWKMDTERAEISVQSPQRAESAVPFRLAGRLGYIDSLGNLLYREDIAYDAAVDTNFFVNYPAAPLYLLVRDRQGNFLGNIGASGYPFIRGGNLFVVSPDGYGLSLFDPQGDLVWEKKFSALITVADSGAGGSVVGLLNGKVSVLGPDGALVYEALPAGDEFPVTLQTGIADDAAYFVSLSGGSPQRLRLFVRQETSYQLVYTAELPSSYRRAVAAEYFSRPDYFIFEQPGGAGILQIEEERLFGVRLPGQLLTIAARRMQGLFFALSREAGRLWGTAFLPNGNPVLRFSCKDIPSGHGVSYFLRAAENYFLIGAGTGLYRIDMGIN